MKQIIIVSVSLLLVASGCQTWECKPLDLEQYAQNWADRPIDVEPVREFAQLLSEAGTNGPASFDLSDGISLQEAEAVALWYNPELRLIRQEAGVPLASAENAGLWDDPELSLEIMAITSRGRRGGYRVRGPSFEGVNLGGPEIRPLGIYRDDGNWVEKPLNFGAGLNLTIPVSGRLVVEQDLAWAQYDSAWQQIALREWKAVTTLRIAWYEWSATGRHMELMRAYLDELETVLRIAQALADNGELKPSDARLFRIEQASRRVELRNIEAMHRQQKIAILYQMGLCPDGEIHLQSAIRTALISMTESQQQAAVLESHPRILHVMAEYEAAEQALRYEVQSQYPDITIGPGYAYEDGLPKFGLGIGFPLPLWNANRRAIGEARAARDAARVRAEIELEAVMNQLSDTRIRLEVASDRRDLLEREVAPMVDQQVSETRTLVELGEVDVLLLEDALVRDYSTKVDVLNAALEEARAAEKLRSILEPLRFSGNSLCDKGSEK